MKRFFIISLLVLAFSHMINAQYKSLNIGIIDSLSESGYYTYLGNNEFTDCFRSQCFIPWVNIKINEISFKKESKRLHLAGKVINKNGKEYAISYAKIMVGCVKDTETAIPPIFIGEKKIDYGDMKTVNKYFHPVQIFAADKNGEFDLEFEIENKETHITFLFPENTKGLINIDGKGIREPVIIMSWVKLINIGKILEL